MDYLPFAIVFAGFFLAYWLYEVEYKRYRLDRLRHNLYELREDLFRKAAAGEIPFESQASQLLRTNINGLIRFSHDLTFFRVALMDRERHSAAGKARVVAYRKLIQECTEELNVEQKRLFASTQRKIHETVILYVGFNSIPGIVVFGTVGTLAFLYNLVGEVRRVGFGAKAFFDAGSLTELRSVRRSFEVLDKEVNRIGCAA